MTSESSENESNSDSSPELKKKKKHKHKEKKHKKKKNKHSSDLERRKKKKKKNKSSKEKKIIRKSKKSASPKSGNIEIPGPSIPDDILIQSSKSRAPMTKEEWEKSQNVVRRVYDETGRSRLIKGDGEVIEEIVSKDRHREINRQATLGDGLYFQSKLAKK